jgi:hypothetical protein
MPTLRAVAAVGAGVVALGLSWNTGQTAFSREAPTRPARPASLQGASVTGTVKLVGKPAPNPPIDMSREPDCQAKYKTAPLDEIVAVNANGTLGNVFVYAKSGLPADARYPTPAPLVLEQKDCLYIPHVFGLMVGQRLLIHNSDPMLHNVKAIAKKNRGFNFSQPRAGMTEDRTFAAPEVMVVLESNTHPWMRAYAGVLPHPFFSVTGTDGSFSIRGLPPGTYTIEAWQEEYGQQTATVTVQADETKTVDFTYAAK